MDNIKGKKGDAKGGAFHDVQAREKKISKLGATLS